MLDAIKGELRIFTKEVAGKTRYQTCIAGTKQEDGKYLNCYVPVHFSKKVDINEIYDQTDLVVKEAWFQVFKDKADKWGRLSLFINTAKIIK